MIEIDLSHGGLRHHAGIELLVVSHLRGRVAAAEVVENSLIVDFQVEDDTSSTRVTVGDFATKLTALLGRHAKRLDVRFITLEADVMEGILADHRPKLRAL